MRKERLTIRRVRAISLALACALAMPLWLAATNARAVTTSLVTTIVTDPLTGVALEGYDPVSYFTTGAPEHGAPEFEYEWGGVPWYFVSAANRDVFARTPEVYAPMFGGYGSMALARGYLSAGNPRIFAILGTRLFLFYSTGNREAFLVAPRTGFADAEANWQELSKNLTSN